ncbi:ABC-2 type transport system ATP-binding protein [Amycolatopsis xylanica]|uniref:ABC-2 type transport system ATP-binding protein n=1 Tax=Amycolatopsis xylanica TaxID=589385 RepID=A0A1H2V9B5_9PSEU|nr:ATP-binding cassette domain-containing protein [Amycolatopsis xylanica]SDW64897.1 ABC-2 type transport system ATP-binding protein [Amycolatopsis xylanica]
MGNPEYAVVTDGLRKNYGDAVALRGIDLAVPAGSVCGLLGPNGAGKTTTVRILSTLLRYDGGRAEVAGFDVARRGADVRRSIGLVGQHAAVDEVLSGRQNLVMFGRLHHLRPQAARRRADELLAEFGLDEAGGKPVKQYLGGMRRRLDLAAGLLLSPAVLFLDEPTTGLDPRGRAEVWAAVRSLVAGGMTVLLTTQYLEEADQLADRIAVVDHGTVIADGTPAELKSALGGDRIEVVLRTGEDASRAAKLIGAALGAEVAADAETYRVSVAVADRVRALTEVTRALDEAGVPADDIALRGPTLDEVFLRLTEKENA